MYTTYDWHTNDRGVIKGSAQVGTIDAVRSRDTVWVSGVRWDGPKQSPHAIDRRKERGISRESIRSIEDIKKLPIYGTDNGCTKYLDMEAWKIKVNSSLLVEAKDDYPRLKDMYGIVYYVRGNRIVTMVKQNPIGMLRYYVIGIQSGLIKKECGNLCKTKCKCLNFNNYCRDHSFKNCKRGKKCKYIHVN